MTTGSVVRLVLLVLPLGLDTFALSILLGVTPMATRTRLRLALTFALAEGLMPAVGLVLGLPLGQAIGDTSGYLAGILLCGLGAWLWWRAHNESNDKSETGDVADGQAGRIADTCGPAVGEATTIARAAHASGWGVLGLALSVSLDELAAGFSFGVARVPVVQALILIALQALLRKHRGTVAGSARGQAPGGLRRAALGAGVCAARSLARLRAGRGRDTLRPLQGYCGTTAGLRWSFTGPAP